ncbi:MAG: apolipoprotein N-acyltransferase [Pseudomonadota bacterium]
MLVIGASFLLGLLLPLGFAPFGFWWLLPPLIAAYAALWIGKPARSAFWTGFAFGGGGFLAGTYWLYHSIHTIGQAPVVLALFLMLGLVAIMALYFGACAVLVNRLSAASRPLAIALLPGVFVLLEWLRGWVLSGFPWLSLGYSLPETLLAGWLPVGGVYLGTLVLCVASSALLGIAAGGRQRLVAISALLVIAVISVALHDRQWVRIEPRELSAHIGQLGLDQSLKWSDEQFLNTLQWYGQFVAAHRGADILLMPEVALPTVADQIEDYLVQISEIANSANSDLLLGILRRDDQGKVANALLVAADGERQWYEKRHLVPFGEYFPVPAFIREWMRLRGLPFSDLKSGADKQSPLLVSGLPIASSICYEDAYGSEQLAFFPDARFIVNVSNDAWFGDSIAPHQHLQIARARSAESQRWQLRATNTGITAIIDDRGRVTNAAPSFEPAVLSGTVRAASGHTPYTRTGNWPALLIALALCAALSLLSYRLRSRK